MPSNDPTGTYLLRRRAVAAMRGKLAAFKAAVWAYLDPGPTSTTKLQLNTPAAWWGLDTVGKLEAWREWLNSAVAKGFLEAEEGAVDHWYATFLKEAYTKGATMARQDVTPPEVDIFESLFSNDRFISQRFVNGVAVEQVRLVFLRAYDLLTGITKDMSAKLGAIMADGLAHNQSLTAIARRISTEIDGIGRKRALVLAQNEIIYAFNEGLLDSYEEIGVDRLTIDLEFVTAGDERVCPVCRKLAKKRKFWTVKQARGVIPAHPGCRCRWRAVRAKAAVKRRTILGSNR